MSNDECKKLAKNEWKKWIGVAGRMLLAYALVFAQGAWASQNQATKDKSGSPQKAAQQTNEKQSAAATTAQVQSKQVQGEESESAVAEEKPSGDGQHEGIKVHGHWTIEVRNPDGSVVTHREFENAYNPSGFLAGLFARQSSVGGWEILFAGANTPCFDSTGPQACIVVESTGRSGANFFKTLGISANNQAFVLSGTAIAQVTGAVGNVSTLTWSCPGTVAPGSCPANPVSPNYVTGTVLSSPVNVSVGQTIAVTVVISFS